MASACRRDEWEWLQNPAGNIAPNNPTDPFSFEIRRTTFPNFMKFADLLILRLKNGEKARRKRLKLLLLFSSTVIMPWFYPTKSFAFSKHQPDPTGPFTISELSNPSPDVPEKHHLKPMNKFDSVTRRALSKSWSFNSGCTAFVNFADVLPIDLFLQFQSLEIRRSANFM